MSDILIKGMEMPKSCAICDIVCRYYLERGLDGLLAKICCAESRLPDCPLIPAEGQGYILAPQDEYDGLKRKYVVLKSDTGEVVENCFVLRPDKDKAAIAALLAYADATDNQVLAKDIRAWISTIPAEEGE